MVNVYTQCTRKSARYTPPVVQPSAWEQLETASQANQQSPETAFLTDAQGTQQGPKPIKSAVKTQRYTTDEFQSVNGRGDSHYNSNQNAHATLHTRIPDDATITLDNEVSSPIEPTHLKTNEPNATHTSKGPLTRLLTRPRQKISLPY